MRIIIKKIKIVIKNLNPKNVPSYDFINNQILQKLPEMGIKFITQLCNSFNYNSILRWGFFRSQWKAVQINMIQKPDKSAQLAES
jgi:hypothetical protein